MQPKSTILTGHTPCVQEALIGNDKPIQGRSFESRSPWTAQSTRRFGGNEALLENSGRAANPRSFTIEISVGVESFVSLLVGENSKMKTLDWQKLDVVHKTSSNLALLDWCEQFTPKLTVVKLLAHFRP